MAHPIEELAHDHRELSGLLIAVQDALGRIERGQSALEDELHEIRDGVEGLRDALLDHFAREQEGLLPFVVARLPAFVDRADTLIEEHDRIAEALTRVVRDLASVDREEAAVSGVKPDTAAAFTAWRGVLDAFQLLYAAHTQSELRFLEEVATALATDPEAAEQLRVLLDGS